MGSECVCPQCYGSLFSHGGVPCHRPWNFPSISQEFKRNAKGDSGTPRQIVSNHYMHGERPNYTTTPAQYRPKPLLSGYQPQVGSGRAASRNIAVRKFGEKYVQTIVARLIATYDLQRLLTVNNTVQQPRHHQCILKKTNTTHLTSIYACNLPKPRPHKEYVFQDISRQSHIAASV